MTNNFVAPTMRNYLDLSPLNDYVESKWAIWCEKKVLC